MLKQLLVPAFLTTLALSACGSPTPVVPNPTPNPPPPPALATCPDTIAIRDFKFVPATCQVAPGTTLSFVNEDSALHNASSTEGAAATFKTANLDEGETAQVTFAATGEYPYECTFHPGMVGNITVQ